MESRAEILQNVEKILTTPVGSQDDTVSPRGESRKDFGSYVPMLIKRPLTASVKLSISAEANEAIANQMPASVRVVQTEVLEEQEGNVLLKVHLIVEGERTVLKREHTPP